MGVCMRYVVLLIKHATRMCHIVTSFVAALAPSHFSIPRKRHDLRAKGIEHKMCVSIVSTAVAQNMFHSKKNLTRYCHKYENVFI
jgi:hypothetical protein